MTLFQGGKEKRLRFSPRGSWLKPGGEDELPGVRAWGSVSADPRGYRALAGYLTSLGLGSLLCTLTRRTRTGSLKLSRRVRSCRGQCGPRARDAGAWGTRGTPSPALRCAAGSCSSGRSGYSLDGRSGRRGAGATASTAGGREGALPCPRGSDVLKAGGALFRHWIFT